MEGWEKKPTMVQDKIIKWEAKDGKFVACIILNLIYNVVLHASFAINWEESFNHLINLMNQNMENQIILEKEDISNEDGGSLEYGNLH